VNIVLIGVIASFCNLIADFSLLVMLSIALFVIDPVIALLSILVFGITAFGLHIATRKRALKFGQINSEMNIASNTAILNLFALYRELNVRNRKVEFTTEIAKIRNELGRAIAEVNFLPNLSKYLLEITLVLGGFLIVGVELLLQNAVNAVGALAVFLTAASRITPALLRVQQSATGIKNSIGMSLPTLNILEELQEVDDKIQTWENSKLKSNFSGKKTAEILFGDVSFCYPDSIANAISDVSISIQKNEMVALVGPSGSGKSTLVDLLLGVLRPSKGFIEICGISNERAIRGNEFKIGYVPQSVSLIEGTLRENLTFGFKAEEFTDFDIWEALGKAELSEDLKIAQITLDSRMGAGGKMLSGGQKQRLGIARALLPSPQILVMDEATSALDSETEDKLNSTIAKMKGSVTLLIIAHRLSSVMNSDRVLYLDKGKLVASGTFSEVRSVVSDFDNQAKLMGL
jgi:ATP-binding cassette subfamily C protein